TCVISTPPITSGPPLVLLNIRSDVELILVVKLQRNSCPAGGQAFCVAQQGGFSQCAAGTDCSSVYCRVLPVQSMCAAKKPPRCFQKSGQMTCRSVSGIARFSMASGGCHSRRPSSKVVHLTDT